jgi:hypothetical protein
MVSAELQAAVVSLWGIMDESYSMEQGVSPNEANYLDRTYIPEAIARTEDIKSTLVVTLVESIHSNNDHGHIRRWNRAACGVARFLLLPTEIREVNLEYARDVVVRISGWYYTHNNLWIRFLPTVRLVVQQLWGDIDRFRDEEDNHIWEPPGIKG